VADPVAVVAVVAVVVARRRPQPEVGELAALADRIRRPIIRSRSFRARCMR
jgi:hypothetical protein